MKTLLLSFGGAGRFPYAPGTMGSLATLPVLFLLSYVPIWFLWIWVILGSWLGSRWIQDYIDNSSVDLDEEIQDHDPSWIVWDEVMGLSLSFCFFPMRHWAVFLVHFILFRTLDILKPWPISLIDRHMHSGLGVMLDDLVAGALSGLITLFLFSTLSFF